MDCGLFRFEVSATGHRTGDVLPQAHGSCHRYDGTPGARGVVLGFGDRDFSFTTLRNSSEGPTGGGVRSGTPVASGRKEDRGSTTTLPPKRYWGEVSTSLTQYVSRSGKGSNIRRLGRSLEPSPKSGTGRVCLGESVPRARTNLGSERLSSVVTQTGDEAPVEACCRNSFSYSGPVSTEGLGGLSGREREERRWVGVRRDGFTDDFTCRCHVEGSDLPSRRSSLSSGPSGSFLPAPSV